MTAINTIEQFNLDQKQMRALIDQASKLLKLTGVQEPVLRWLHKYFEIYSQHFDVVTGAFKNSSVSQGLFDIAIQNEMGFKEFRELHAELHQPLVIMAHNNLSSYVSGGQNKAEFSVAKVVGLNQDGSGVVNSVQIMELQRISSYDPAPFVIRATQPGPLQIKLFAENQLKLVANFPVYANTTYCTILPK